MPAVVHFLSIEPQLGPIDLGRYILPGVLGAAAALKRALYPLPTGLPLPNWVIVGGESGGGARPFAIQWARSLVEQCREANVACFVKQLGARPIDTEYETGVNAPHDKRSIAAAKSLGLGGEGYAQFNLIMLKDRKHGGDIAEFPPDLQVRDFPRLEA